MDFPLIVNKDTIVCWTNVQELHIGEIFAKLFLILSSAYLPGVRISEGLEAEEFNKGEGRVSRGEEVF